MVLDLPSASADSPRFRLRGERGPKLIPHEMTFQFASFSLVRWHPLLLNPIGAEFGDGRNESSGSITRFFHFSRFIFYPRSHFPSRIFFFFSFWRFPTGAGRPYTWNMTNIWSVTKEKEKLLYSIIWTGFRVASASAPPSTLSSFLHRGCHIKKTYDTHTHTHSNTLMDMKERKKNICKQPTHTKQPIQSNQTKQMTHVQAQLLFHSIEFKSPASLVTNSFASIFTRIPRRFWGRKQKF